MHLPIDTFWGKLRHAVPTDRTSAVVAWHPLRDHCADVAACALALLRQDATRRRLARLGGVEELGEAQIHRLAVFAALHDIGKFNRGFQAKASPGPAGQAGHVIEVVRLFRAEHDAASHLAQALRFDALASWFKGDLAEEHAGHLLVAGICHHGRPELIEGAARDLAFDRIWRRGGPLDPFDGINQLVAATRRWLPEAWEPGGAPLPATPAFQHEFSGLVMLADWLGSDTHAELFPFASPEEGDRFPFAVTRARHALMAMGMDAGDARRSLGPDRPDFSRVSPHAPRAAQRAILELPTDQHGSLVILEAETGSGKTEAALGRFLRLFHAGQVDGMVFALPTRTSATQMYARVCAAVRDLAFPDLEAPPPVVLAVPGYIGVDGQSGQTLPGFEVLWDDGAQNPGHLRGWAAENSKRYLAGAVAVGTVDQVLLSGLQVKHAHLRATALLRQLLIVDEVHASDAYMTRLLEGVLARHMAAGGHALLLSATLGASARSRLLAPLAGGVTPPFEAAAAQPYPLLSWRGQDRDIQELAIAGEGNARDVIVEIAAWADDAEAVVTAALEQACRGARVGILRNTVSDAVATQEVLERLATARGQSNHLFRCVGAAAPHHARFAREDREKLDREIELRFGKASAAPCVVVATQTIQQSLDIDFDALYTDLCPMDVLLQRVGRLHRHTRPNRPPGLERPRIVVLTPADRDLGVHLRQDGRATGPHGLGTVYADVPARGLIALGASASLGALGSADRGDIATLGQWAADQVRGA